MQAIDLELLDLEVSDNRPPDRKPANGQGADGTGADGRCADRGRAEASCSKPHRGRPLPAGTEPWKGPRERSAIAHELLLLAQQEPGPHVGCRSSLLHYHLPPTTTGWPDCDADSSEVFPAAMGSYNEQVLWADDPGLLAAMGDG